MGFFDKMFGKKDTSGAGAAEPLAINFTTALLMHVRGELQPALNAYLSMMEHDPKDNLAPFFAAAIRAGQGNVGEAAEMLRGISRRTADEGQTISHVVSLEVEAVVSEEAYITTPAVVEIIAGLGDRLKGGGFVQESAVCFEIAAGLAPEQADVLHKFGDTLHDLRMYEYAESVLREALKLAPNHWGAMYTYAVLLQDLGRDEESIPYYEKAVRFNPDHARCHNNFGAALMRTNRLDEALAQCTTAAELDPASPFVQINLGNINLLKHDYEAARSCFTKAISLDENLPPAYFGLASAERFIGGDPGRVRDTYLKAIQLNPSVPEFHHAFGTFLAENANGEALLHFSAAVQLNTNLRNLHRDFGAACLQLGRREEGLEQLRIALEQDPDDEAARELLAKAGG